MGDAGLAPATGRAQRGRVDNKPNPHYRARSSLAKNYAIFRLYALPADLYNFVFMLSPLSKNINLSSGLILHKISPEQPS
jgi:hypothetical protein